MTALFDAQPPAPSRSENELRPRSERAARCEIRDGRLLITGDLDQAGCASIRSGLVGALGDRSVSVIDLSNVSFFGAAGITLLIEFGMHERHEVVGSPLIRRVLDLVGCPHLLRDAALPN